MKFSSRFVVLCLAAVALIAAAIYVAVAMRGKGGNLDSAAENGTNARHAATTTANSSEEKVLERLPEKGSAEKQPARNDRQSDVGTDPAGATAEVGPGDEEPLTEQQKAVSSELQSALDGNDLKAVLRAIAKFKASSAQGGLEGNVTKSMRRQAVQALAWFGKDGVIDLIDFLADEDESIASDAYDQFELAMNSGDMSQAECSMYLKAIMTALTDSERIDNLLVNLAPMDNSVKAATIMEILAKGTPEAKKVMREQLEFYTDAGVVTVEDVQKWALENPDGE